MDKGRRREIAKLKQKKRIKNLCISPQAHSRRKLGVLKTTGKPCSCHMCSPKDEKAKYRVKHKGRAYEQDL